MTDALYHEMILDLYRHPLNKRTPGSYDHKYEMQNALCSDSVALFLRTDGKTITEITWDGEGCALSVASASMVTDHLRGKPLSAIEDMNQETVLGLLHLTDLTPSRLRCALLPLEALRKK